MARVIGRFYFRKTGNGNLLGEYSNNGMRRSDAECANLETSVDPIEGMATDPFAGQYITTWLEDHKPRQARLSIAVRPGATGIYTVTWTAFNHTTLFWGEAMIAGDLLIGDYRNFDPF